MAGGLLSAVAVGVILEVSDGYAAVVAESYDNLEADEAFWQGLSEEEAKKAREMLAKVKQQKGQNEPTTLLPTNSATTTTVTSKSADSAPLATEAKSSTTTTTTYEADADKKVDMFSDY